METKRLFLTMAIGLMLVLGWPYFIGGVARMLGYDLSRSSQTEQRLTEATPTDSATPVTALPTAATSPTTAGVPTTGEALRTTGYSPVAPAAGATTAPALGGIVRLGSIDEENETFAIALDLNPKGAGLDGVVLNDYKLTLKSPEPFTYEKPGNTYPGRTRSLAVRGVKIDGTDVDLTDATWTLAGQDADASDGQVSASYELTIARDGTPVLVLRRTYTVYTRSWTGSSGRDASEGPLGFEPRIATSFRNLTDQPMNVALRYNGQGVPPSESERYIDAFYVLGTGSGDGVVTAHGNSTGGINATPTDLVSTYAESGRPWFTGAMTTYFAAMHRFEPLTGESKPVDWFDSIVATALTPGVHDVNREAEVLITLKPVEVKPGETIEVGSRAYFGPRKREFLTNDHFASPWVRYDTAFALDQGLFSRICGICTWQWLIDILFSILKVFHFVFRDWGLAIIGLVCLVRLALHPITKRSQMNMLKFGKLAPEMERIKKKYANDQEAMNRAMMGFYKEHGTTQLMGCLPMFLQMPIWIALWQAMNTTFELRHEPFFYGLTWIKDLSKPDHLIDFGHAYTLPLLSFVIISGINVLPVLFGGLQWMQFKIQPKPPTMTDEQRQQQQMTQWMLLILMPVMLYASPSGLMIYMITSFTIGIIESKIVKKQFEAMTANEAKFTVVEEDSPVAAKAEKAKVRRVEPAPKKKGLMGMIEEARRKAMEMQAQIEKDRKKNR